MADQFKSYDKTPIIEMLNRANRWNFGLREIILLVITALLLLFCLIFAGLFGRAEAELAGGKPSASALVGASFCTDASCLKTAARALELMNTSVDPCENFYEFACGNYKVSMPIYPNRGSRNVLLDIYEDNQDRLIQVLEAPISQMHDYAAEKKMKNFFQSCNNMYIREKNKGVPFIEKVIGPLGGWKVLGNWDPNWDFNTALKKVHADFWLDALYSPSVQVDWFQGRKRVIQIAPGGTGKWMHWIWYTHPNTEKYREDYKKFIRRVGSFLIRDAVDAPLQNSTLQSEYLEEFVNDTFSVEQNIARIATSSRYNRQSFKEANKVSLQDLNTETGNIINWVDQMSYLFNTAGVTGNTKVVLLRREYFQNMTTMIAAIPENERKRMLHNYLIWRVAETYVQDLSWDYVHANREIYVDIYNRQAFSGVYKYCFSLVKFYMDDALSSLFVGQHFVDNSKETVTEITTNMKLALQTQLDKTPWMDDTTKKYAKEKLDAVTFKMGYPEWMANQGYVDQMYNGLTINTSDFFGNLLSANQFKREEWNEELRTLPSDREEWIFSVYSTVMAVYWSWNEVIAPAGILQPPIYSKNQPHHATFGALGSLLGRFIHHIVDEWGKNYDKSGKYIRPDTWWSNQSLSNYETVKSCVLGVYTNVSKLYLFPDGEWSEIPINPASYTPVAISWTNGVRLAQIGYRDWVQSQGLAEKMLPGLGMTNEQMVFLAHAQTFCYAREPQEAFLTAIRGQVDEEIRVNMALGQLEEFSKAFSCKPESQMNHPKKCDYY